MKVQQQSIDQFQQLNDQLLTYSFSSRLDKDSPRNKTQQPNRNQNISEHSKLKLQQDNSKEIKETFFKFNDNSRINGSQARHIIRIGDAVFKSNFQCGNLCMVDNIGHNIYKLYLSNEINSDRMSLWFYFNCSGLKGQVTFIISGFTKPSSLYNEGMKICCRQVGDVWRRGGSKISYYRDQQQLYYSLKFSFFFPNSGNNTYEFAYCFPYSFTKLLNFIYEGENNLHIQVLTKSYQKRAIPLLTIGNPNSENVIFLSARVHPGQTVSSWIMQGFIRQLLSQNIHSQLLRKTFLFKIVPMLNPDGVFRGNYRFSGAGCDLNRKWNNCSSQRQPQIYYWKQYMIKMSKTKNILMYIDIHGHSRKKNVFFYGCSPVINGVRCDEAKQFPYLMEEVHGAAYRYQYCCFSMPKDKQGTARLTMCKQLKNNYIYTLQSTFCGGQANNNNFIEADYQKIGNKLSEGIAIYFSEYFDIQSHQTQPKVLEALEKFKLVKKKKIQEFNKNSQLRQVGMFDGSGSQSEPQRGQNKQIYVDCDKFEPRPNNKIDKALISKRKDNEKRLKFNSNIKLQNLKRKVLKNSTTNAFQTLRIQRSKLQKQKPDSSANHEVSLRKNYITRPGTNQHRVAFEQLRKIKLERNFEQVVENINEGSFNINIISTNQSLRRKLMLERGGAQYRRVKKLAQQNSRNNSFVNSNIFSGLNIPVIRGLIGINNDLQLDLTPNKKSKTLTNPNLYPSTSYGTRKGSIEFSLKKHITRRVCLNDQENEVKCYGSKIPIHL